MTYKLFPLDLTKKFTIVKAVSCLENSKYKVITDENLAIEYEERILLPKKGISIPEFMLNSQIYQDIGYDVFYEFDFSHKFRFNGKWIEMIYEMYPKYDGLKIDYDNTIIVQEWSKRHRSLLIDFHLAVNFAKATLENTVELEFMEES